ncbi:hypothetical protein HX870_00500 [Pseudomonas gingeri]|uniref:hypothetical protein n=1 Tax=Pseudomonas gingeri TaxID=117681 RepID=UPI0015A167C6|nr:hypothetical protein [Pseudomonas gingeri]NWD66099.1 hypothetical protein [Pseudomonas gingeri]
MIDLLMLSISGGFLLLAYFIVRVVTGQTVIVRDGVAHVTLSGWVKVKLLRAVVPFFAGVSRSAGIKKIPVHLT